MYKYTYMCNYVCLDLQYKYLKKFIQNSICTSMRIFIFAYV